MALKGRCRGSLRSCRLRSPSRHCFLWEHQRNFPRQQKMWATLSPRKNTIPHMQGVTFPTQVLWGDTHLHTGNSLDAGAFGARLSARRMPIALRAVRS